jgi:2-phospho-L-lactate guanylyltransferase
MMEASQDYDVVLAVSQEGTGTNALCVRSSLAFPYVFGPNSLQHYLGEAKLRGLRSTVYKSPGLSCDIDTIDDLELLQMYAWEYKQATTEDNCIAVL